MNEREAVFLQCAHMILNDQCPPERGHYLCMNCDDDVGDCTQCWFNYLWGLSVGTIDPHKARVAIKGGVSA